MTVTEHQMASTFDLVTVDLYRDIHKGIRAELFAATLASGRIDPGDHQARVALADQVRSVCGLLVSHAEHEDRQIQPALGERLPVLAAEIADAHASIDARLVVLQAAADAAASAPRSEQRGRLHHLHLDLATFTATYLEHEDYEERVVMPALEAAIGVDAVVGIHQAIVGSIPPDEMASSLAVMLPAMNLDDRAELLGGMQAGAPPEVFAGVWALAGSVLDGPDAAALGARLGLA